MGKASGVARADTVTTPEDHDRQRRREQGIFYTSLPNPRACTPVPATITKASGKTRLQAQLQGPERASDRRGHPHHARLRISGRRQELRQGLDRHDSCPSNKKWAYSIETEYLFEDGSTDDASYDGSTRLPIGTLTAVQPAAETALSRPPLPRRRGGRCR